MIFSDKLNFLIDITHTRNNALAAAVNIDASHVSRLRRGNRTPPENQNYVLLMSRYFVRNLKSPLQKKAVFEALRVKEGFPLDEENAVNTIYKWLIAEEEPQNARADSFISAFTNRKTVEKDVVKPEVSENKDEKKAFYYGNSGKRAAVIRLLTAVCNLETPKTLLLFSDEDMTWMTEDPVFVKNWTILLQTLLSKGNRIKIIHTINRDADEMMEAVTKWVPIYSTGLIEPYYYPKLRDGVFQRTLFIVPEVAAIVSSSVGKDSSEMLNIYIDSKEAVSAVQQEYQRLFALCKPLMNIYNPINSDKFLIDFVNFAQLSSSSIFIGPTPSLMTMPQSLAAAMAARSGSTKFYSVWETCASMLDTNLSNNFDEIITVNGIVNSDKMPLPLSDIFRADLYYTKEEYAAHVENTLLLMEKYPNYKVGFSNVQLPVMIWGKEDTGVMLANADTPSTVFRFDERNLTSAFWDYLAEKRRNSLKNDRDKVFKAVEVFLKSLK